MDSKVKINFEDKAKYRCEQTIVIKTNGTILNHADTKLEFEVHRHSSEKGTFIKTELLDSIIDVHPQSFSEALKIILDVDKIKYNTIVSTCSKTGKIDKIFNHKEIIEQWEEHKKGLYSQYGYLRSQEIKENLNKFISITENQIADQNTLKLDLEARLFFDLFFDKYLVVTDQSLYDPYERTFYSQLFDGAPIGLNIKQNIISESQNTVQIRKVSNFKKKGFGSAFESMYDKKFKPTLKYKYSEFNFSYREHCLLNTKDKWIENSEVTMIEEVKNNIQLLADYKLRKIE